MFCPNLLTRNTVLLVHYENQYDVWNTYHVDLHSFLSFYSILYWYPSTSMDILYSYLSCCSQSGGDKELQKDNDLVTTPCSLKGFNVSIGCGITFQTQSIIRLDINHNEPSNHINHPALCTRSALMSKASVLMKYTFMEHITFSFRFLHFGRWPLSILVHVTSKQPN